jgi:hypothetical protein
MLECCIIGLRSHGGVCFICLYGVFSSPNIRSSCEKNLPQHMAVLLMMRFWISSENIDSFHAYMHGQLVPATDVLGMN